MKQTLVIIPAYNEAENLPEVIGRVRAALPAADVLVVDDGSKDQTAAVAAQQDAIVVSHGCNMGYGVAIQTGYKYAKQKGYDFLVQIDGDGQHDAASLPTLLAPVQEGEVDFAIGSRFLSDGNYRPPFVRRVGMQLFRKLVSVIIGQTITDTTSGYQAFNRRVIHFLASDFFPCDYPDADLLIILHRAGFRMTERPVGMSANRQGRSMHSGFKPAYYVFKMFLSIGVTLLRAPQKPPGGGP